MSSLMQAGEAVEGRGADILTACLIQAGIDTLFGVPGDTGVILYDALYQRQDDIRHILARDERHAAFMADAYARSTNTVGVVEASSGGGVTYVLGGLGDAYASSIPLLVLTTDIHRRSRGTGALTEIDQTKLFSAVTKWAVTVEAAADIPRCVCEALAAATSGRPGPVSLVIPEDVLDEHARVTLPEMSATLPHVRPGPDEKAVHEAAELLRMAERPAILAGGGVHLSAAWHELYTLAETAGIPVATSIHGKGALAETNAWSLGVVGANGARDYANQYLAEADVVLMVGTRANATDTNSFQGPARGGARVIHIDIEAERAGRNYPDSLPLVGDAQATLAALASDFRSLGDFGGLEQTRRREQLLSWIAAQREAWTETTSATVEIEPDLLDPRDIVRAVQRLAPPDVLLVGEPGTPTPNISAYWETPAAGRSIIIPRGHGPMGYVIPAAIGVAVANPGQQVVGMTGDGSFAMACGELETAARLDLPIVYIQFTNGSLGWIKMLQHLYTDQRYFGVDLGPIDVVKVAHGMGLAAHRVTSLDDFESVFRLALGLHAPVYIDVPVPDQIHLTPPVAPWQATLTRKAGRPTY